MTEFTCYDCNAKVSFYDLYILYKKRVCGDGIFTHRLVYVCGECFLNADEDERHSPVNPTGWIDMLSQDIETHYREEEV